MEERWSKRLTWRTIPSQNGTCYTCPAGHSPWTWPALQSTWISSAVPSKSPRRTLIRWIIRSELICLVRLSITPGVMKLIRNLAFSRVSACPKRRPRHSATTKNPKTYLCGTQKRVALAQQEATTDTLRNGSDEEEDHLVISFVNWDHRMFFVA